MTKAFHRVALWHLELSSRSKAAITAALAALWLVAGYLLEPKVQLLWNEQPKKQLSGVAWTIVAFVAVAIYGFARHLIGTTQEQISERRRRQDSTIANAREKVAAVDKDSLVRLANVRSNLNLKISEYVEALAIDIDRMEAVIRAIWEVVNSAHNPGSSSLDRLNLEVTLITPSIRDGKLTIAAWANRENRAPKSLQLREKDPEIYDKTKAAELIRDGDVEVLVIPDTSPPEVRYSSLYDGQKRRIKSSVLFPVMSAHSEPLGVIVVHCDEVGVFSLEDKRYWKELLSVFAPALAMCLERIRAHNFAATRIGTTSLMPVQPY